MNAFKNSSNLYTLTLPVVNTFIKLAVLNGVPECLSRFCAPLFAVYRQNRVN